LFYSILITPFRIAFTDYDPLGWLLLDCFVDLIFAADIVINFYTAYFDFDDNLITDRRIIAKAYLKGWFFIDFISILPISPVIQYSRDYSSLARLTRLPRLYRLMKMAK
jgi:hypothetical protein